jgi:hypothetical protein
MRMLLRVQAVPFVVVTAIGVAACGGGDDSDDFIPDADAICTDEQRQIVDQQLARPTIPTGTKEIVEVFEAGNPIYQDAQDQLSELEPPGAVSADWDEFLSLNQQRIDARADAIAAADDRKAFDAAADEAVKLLEDRDEVGERIGLGPCANVLSEEDQQAVTAAEDELSAAVDAERICTEIFLEQYAEAFYGDVQKCSEDPAVAKPIEHDISEVSGVDGVRAFVELEITAGQPQLEGRPLIDEWYYVDGEWRLYSTNSG